MRYLFAAVAVIYGGLMLNASANAETLDLVGFNSQIAEPPVSVELPNGLTYLTVVSKQVHFGRSANNPVDRAISSCIAGCTVDSSGGGNCLGSCSGYDVDGDVFSFTWDGMTGGTWTLVGGSGKYNGATGGGDWTGVPTSDASTALPEWTGTITMK